MDQSRIISRDVEFSLKLGGIIRNWKLVFNKVASHIEGVGWANIVPNESSVVEGIIYKISDKSIANLDYYEGYPEDYQKHEMLVESGDGELLKCTVYIANPSKVREDLKPTKEYLSYLLQGGEFLSENYLTNLKKIQTSD